MNPAFSKFSRELQWWLVVTILFFSTVAFGGRDPQTIFFIRLLIFVGFTLQVVSVFWDADSFSNFPTFLFAPILIFFAFLAIVCIQYLLGLKLLQGSVIGSISPYRTIDSLIQLVFYFQFFIVCLQVTSRRDFIGRLGSFVAVLTFTIAVLGLAQKLLPDEAILWKKFSSERGAFFGPFINENHFGGFLALTFPFVLGLMHYRFDRVKRELTQDRPKHPFWKIGTALMNEGVAFLFFLVIMTLVACFFSLARIPTLVILLCCVGYFAGYGMKKGNVRFYLVLSVILICAFSLIQWLGYANLLPVYFSKQALQQALSIRIDIAKQSLGLFRLFPLFGTGLGTYDLISSKVVSRLINEVSWNHAHNDYIELLTDTGIAGFSLLMGAILGLLFPSLRKINRNSSGWDKTIRIQASLSILCIGALEFSDFHLKVPSIALFFILQLALLTTSSSFGEKSGLPLLSASKFYKDKSILFTGLVLCAPIIFFSVNNFRAVRLAQTKTDRPANLEKATKLEPMNPELWFLLAKEYRESADQLSEQGKEALTLRRESVNALRHAVALNPSYAPYWYYLAIVERAAGYEKESIHSLEQSVNWAPARFKYGLFLLSAYLREAEASHEHTEKTEFLTKAETVYKQLQKLEVKPTEREYQFWMGDYYYKKLQKWAAYWNQEQPL